MCTASFEIQILYLSPKRERYRFNAKLFGNLRFNAGSYLISILRRIN